MSSDLRVYRQAPTEALLLRAAHVEREAAVRERVRAVLMDRRVQIALQPIVDMSTGWTVGFEALTRIADEPDYLPEHFFADAHEAGLGEIAELTAVRTAVNRIGEIPPSAFLAINISPNMATNPRLRSVLPTKELNRIVLELTETTQVEDYPALMHALMWLRANGLRVAIDDTGAGYASLRHVLAIHPEVIKLDGSVTQGIADDPARQAMAWALAWFARKVGAQFIVEGLETGRDVDMVMSFGVQYGQGYALGRPR